MSEEKKTGLSGQFILGVVASLVAAAVWVVLASFWKVLNDERYLPLWGFLTLLTVFIVGFAWIQFLITRNLRAELEDDAETLKQWEEAEKQWEVALQERDGTMGEHLQHWAAAEKGFKDRIAELEGELAERDKVVYRDGLYYRPSDTGSRQPFCRVCWDTDDALTTVVEQMTYEDGSRTYQCPVCEQWHNLPSIPVADPDAYQPPDDGEEIPF